jgi:PD-(D/E)XK nuclease superfamily
MGLVPRGESVDALWFGIGVHEALAQWYRPGLRRGTHPARYFTKWAGEEERYIRSNFSDRDREWFDAPKFDNALDLGTAMLEGYVDKYGKDPEWEVIDTEHPFKTRIFTSREDAPFAEFWSTWDGVYRDLRDGRLYLMEHKTATQIQTAYLPLDDQAGAYWAVAGPYLRAKGILKPDEEIEGITYNFLRKSMPDERPCNEEGQYLNKDGTVSKRQPPPYFVRHTELRVPAEQRTQLMRMADEVKWMNAVRSGEMPVIKNTTKDCTYCEFFLMCQMHEHGGNGWEELMRAEYDQLNPYERYHKDAG